MSHLGLRFKGMVQGSKEFRRDESRSTRGRRQTWRRQGVPHRQLAAIRDTATLALRAGMRARLLACCREVISTIDAADTYTNASRASTHARRRTWRRALQSTPEPARVHLRAWTNSGPFYPTTGYGKGSAAQAAGRGAPAVKNSRNVEDSRRALI